MLYGCMWLTLVLIFVKIQSSAYFTFLDTLYVAYDQTNIVICVNFR